MTTAKDIFNTINNYVSVENEKLFLKHIISEFVLREVNPEKTEKIMRELYKLLTKKDNYSKSKENWNWVDYETYIDSLYLEQEEPNAGLDALSIILSETLKKSEAIQITYELQKILKPFEIDNEYLIETGTNRFIIMNENKKVILFRKVHITERKSEVTDEIIINAYPKEIIIHDSPVSDMGRTFTIKWIAKTSKRLFECTQCSISEIENYLLECGWVINPKYLKGCLASLIQISIDYKLATIKTDIENPGFYYDIKEKQLIKVNVDLPELNHENLRKGLKILNLLGKKATIDLNKLATVIKWSLVAPFNYARKQAGHGWMPWLFLQGKSQSGKTTVGRIGLFIWDQPNIQNDIGGSGFDTVARVGEKLGISTLPLLVNEPEGVLERQSIRGMLKSAIESPVARGKFKGGKYTNLPSFAPVIITSNPVLTQEDAMLRRFHIITFSHKEKHEDKTAKDFDNFFGLENPNRSILLDLHYLASFVYDEIHEDNTIFSLDWQELADTLLLRAYTECGEKVPIWLRGWYKSASLQDLDDEETEIIRMFIFDEINQRNKQIKIFTESGTLQQEIMLNVDEYSEDDEFKIRTWNVLNQRLISWCGVRQTRYGENQVYITRGIVKELGKQLKSTKSLKSIAELLEWEYKPVKTPKLQKVMVVSFEEFVQFLNPDFNDA